jgi:MtaA/CmuA family methyltransferase
MMFAVDQIGAKYREYARDHRVLAEAQIRTAEKFGFDYVSTISDPAREASDLGADIEWFEDQPPAINESHALLHEKSLLMRLKAPDPCSGERMHDRVSGVALLRQQAGAAMLVEGWVEGPCAMSSDLRGINTLMTDFSDDPDFVRDLFEFTVDMEMRFAKAQIEAGADLIGVGDAAASLVGPAIYHEFVLPYEQKLISGIRDLGGRVRLHICGNTKRILVGMGKAGAEMIDIDYPSPMALAREATGPEQVLLGNLNPVKGLRDGTPESVTALITQCHRDAGQRFIVGAGCEICRGTPEENVMALSRYAQSAT